MLIFKYLGYAILLGQCLAQTDPVFRKDYTFIKELNAFYKYDITPKKWSDALETCKAQGSELLVPKSKNEVDILLKLYGNNPDHGFVISWIAANDIFAEGEFITVDGRPLSESYLKWRPGEPNNLGNNEHCLTLDDNGGYVDAPCDLNAKAICKKSAVNLTQNILCDTYDLKYTYTSQTDRCYKFHTTPMNWQRAYKICRDEETHLAVINSEDEAKVFTRMFAQHPVTSLKGNFEKNSIFLGFSDFYNPGLYVTIVGQTLNEAGYENWSPGEPSNDNHHCGSMSRDGTLKALDCNARALFICEKILETPVTESSRPRLPDDQ